MSVCLVVWLCVDVSLSEKYQIYRNDLERIFQMFNWINDLKLDGDWYKSVVALNYQIYRIYIETSESLWSEWYAPNRVRSTKTIKWDGVSWLN